MEEVFMIYTVTFNPAVDYVVHCEEMKSGRVNRSDKEEIYFGGKGINVSLVLKELGVESKALGFTAGFTGEAIEQGVKAQGIDTDFVRLENGCSRINVKIKAGEETELNGQGPEIPLNAVNALFEKLDKLGSEDTLVLAGSIPKTLPDDIYENILEKLSTKGVRCVVDASGKLLLNVLEFKPYLIKPNNFEIAELFGEEYADKETAAEYAQKLREMGAQNVLVSCAGEGAVLADQNGQVHFADACKGEVKNSVGAGDSMLAGFIAGLDKGFAYALKLGTAAGGASAFSDGLAQKNDVEKLMTEQLDEKL